MALTPQIHTRRTDDVSVVKWEMESDGSELYNFIISEVDSDVEVHIVQWRTISVLRPDGTGFSLDRGEYLARGDDLKFFRLTDETLPLLFN